MIKSLLLSLASAQFVHSEQRRSLNHVHLQTSPLYGNSTDLEYFYVTVYVGSQRHPQALIVDTGSSLAAIPCAEYCSAATCGTHINGLFESELSTAHALLSCKTSDCKCISNGDSRCKFYQGYAEGSYYDGYIVKDQIYFGEDYHFGFDSIMYTFGCVKKETNYFYTQEADGILGMSPGKGGSNPNMFEPIYDVLYERELIAERTFTLCLGKNGGYMQIGGYDS